MRKSLLALTSALLLTPGAIAPAMAQRVVNVSPTVNAQNISPDAAISGQFDTSSGTVQAGSVVILVNGQNVTSTSTITPNLFTYRPSTPFPTGPVNVQVEYIGGDGFKRTSSWQFQVQAPRPAVEIASITHNAASSPLGPNTTFLVTINGTPGSQGSVLLVRDGQTVQTLPVQEVSAGVYVATLTVTPNTRLAEGVVVGRLRREGQTSYAIAPQPAVFTATATATTGPSTVVEQPGKPNTAVPLAPVFTSPTNNSTVGGGSFTLVGQTRPGATVDIQVTGSTSIFGLASVGQTLLESQVTADANGVFQINVSLGLLSGRGTRYTVSATASQDGERASSQMNLTHQ
ncbi:hypothetical protein [Leptolyngbya sp. PCC 6406]|uniref:hypothetical protein n=1 Tax=Leptolyngbya sp. PCC 6406 TaxID=1173264 RepID=UPI0002ABEA92|nr:hypothetical protein [Leptolyngbya sp. PCC 6406]